MEGFRAADFFCATLFCTGLARIFEAGAEMFNAATFDVGGFTGVDPICRLVPRTVVCLATVRGAE